MPTLTPVKGPGTEIITRRLAGGAEKVAVATAEKVALATESLQTTFAKIGSFPGLAPFFKGEKTLALRDLQALFESLKALPPETRAAIDKAFQQFTGEPAASIASIAPNLSRLSREQIRILGDFFHNAPKLDAAGIEKAAAETFFDIWRVPGKTKDLTIQQMDELARHMKPGDLVVMGHGETLAGTESWVHASVYETRGNLVHATTDAGVIRSRVRTVLDGEVRAAVLRHRKAAANPAEGGKVAETVKGYIGRPYDFAFAQGDFSKFFCTEVCFGALNESGLGLANNGSVKVGGQQVLQVADMLRHPELQVVHIVQGVLKKP